MLRREHSLKADPATEKNEFVAAGEERRQREKDSRQDPAKHR